MTRELEDIVAALGWTMPCDLAEAASHLGRSAWPEMVGRWSQLTPTGCPIELTVAEGSSTQRWTSEIAGPEIPDVQRLDLVARYLAGANQSVPAQTLSALRATQHGRELQYGAWLGGRVGGDGRSWFKLYGELPADVVPTDVSYRNIPLPPSLMEVAARAPRGTLPRMLGIEPARERIELYLRLPVFDLDDLRPVLLAAGYSDGPEILARHLPDGMRRLVGRRLGISLSTTYIGSPVDVALFVSARTLFPGAPELLHTLVPAIAPLPAALSRTTLVTLRMTPGADTLSFAVGVTIARQTASVQ